MPKAYVPSGTKTRFYIPPTLAADFTEFLDNDIPNTVMNFELIRDWYARPANKILQRGEIYPDSTKSRYTNTDHLMNMRFDVRSGIRKGDMVIDENGKTYLIDWEVSLQSNNAPTRGLICNTTIEVERYHEETTDDDGYLVEPEGYSVIAASIPANAYRYEGRPEYSAVENQPGISPNALRLVTVQYNSQTSHIMVGDVFYLGPERYIVIDIDRVGLDIQQDHGVLMLQARKEPGGTVRV